MRALLVALCVLAVGAGCQRAPRDELVVLGAASLAEVFHTLGRDFELAQPDTRVVFSFAGSQTLAMQLRAGVRADVIATANGEIMQSLLREGRVEPPQLFATNRVVWIVSSEVAPATWDALAVRLHEPGFRLVLAAPEVPAGRYARDALGRLSLRELALARVVSQELDVKGVVSKVQLGEAHAGIAYATDVAAARGALAAVEFPAEAQVHARYLAASTHSAPHPERARAFVAFLSGPEAEARLRASGFGPPCSRSAR